MNLDNSAELGGELIFITTDEPPTRVPYGKYEVSYRSHSTQKFFSSTKLYINFTICDSGEYFGAKLYRAYNLHEGLPSGSDLYKDLVLLYGKKVAKKTRLPISLFKNKILLVTVRTVKSNRKQKPLPEHQMYSVIDSILKVAAGIGS